MGTRLFNFTLISYNVKMDFNDTRLTKQTTFLRLLCSALSTLLDVSFPVECPLFLRSLSRVPLSHLFQSSLPVVHFHTWLVTCSSQVSQWSTFPLGLSPVPVKSPSGQVTQRSTFPLCLSPVPVKSPTGPLMSEAI